MNFADRFAREKGFTLLELSLAIALVGIVAGGGIALLGTLVQHKQRSETLAHMKDVQQALLVYAQVNGKLPPADSSAPADGTGDAGADTGGVPYADLGIRPADSLGSPLKYQVHTNLAGAAACSTLTNFINGSALAGWAPTVWEEEAGVAGASLPVAAVLVSRGQNGTLDAIAGLGDNSAGSSYVRHRPQAEFDDLVLTLGPAGVYYWSKCGGFGYPPL